MIRRWLPLMVLGVLVLLPSLPVRAEGFVKTQMAAPSLPAPADYVMKKDVVEIELSEYAGYAGLIVANGGLEPNESSYFFKKHGFKLKIALSEEESWPALCQGKMAASATTVDVLPIYGRAFNVTVPALIGYSRGADGLVVRSDIKKINALKGKTLVSAQFTEADFFIRYLAFEAGLDVNLLPDENGKPDPEKINLVYAEDGFGAGDALLADVKSGRNRLAGCVTWAPKTTDVVQQSVGKCAILTTSRNLLIVADVLVVNRGFAKANPDKVRGLVDGLIYGNRQVRQNAEGCVEVIAKAFKWERERVSAELEKVHLANLPENLAFFSGAIDAAGSFGGIYQSSVLSYGSIIKNAPDSDYFADLQPLKVLEKGGDYAADKVSIAPIKGAAGGASVEKDPLLSKDLRFLFQPNSSILDLKDKENIGRLDAIRQMLQVSPGSLVFLRGHVDNARLDDFKKQGDSVVRRMALEAMQLSKDRALEIKKLLMDRYNIPAERLEATGRGWEEPTGKDSAQNRRVEVQWFTVE